ncbi:reverse transcriptase domain-containing protein [Actinomadura chokoriensis]|uniref:Reverse transcriptase domain-containing protein n=1 Tax=Actinomadura chokoriensis TaxID=454156 RepID=A0ABV4R6E5_9ACTN
MWILDADLTAAFDRIDHDHLLAMLGAFPAREMIRGWLKAGVFENGKAFAPTEEGTPQGGVISPLLLNVALHGLEAAAGVKHRNDDPSVGITRSTGPVLVRYADDFAVCCHTRRQAEEVKDRLAQWLAPRGLAINEDKTRIVHLTEGFDFLGFNVRRYQGPKLLIKPSDTAVKRLRKRLATEVRALRGSNAGAVIAKLNPIIRGWATYYRGAVSYKIFEALDSYTWRLTYKWAHFRHPNKSKHWVIDQYYGRFNWNSGDSWVFGDRTTVNADGGVAHLVKFRWHNIVRHTTVRGTASPDDPDLAAYWAQRRRRVKPPLDGHMLDLISDQNGVCPLCRDSLISADQPPGSPQQWASRWLFVTRKAIRHEYLVTAGKAGRSGPAGDALRLVHSSCHRAFPERLGRKPAPFRPPF